MEFEKIKAGFKDFLKEKGATTEGGAGKINLDTVNAFDDIDAFQEYIDSNPDFITDETTKDIEEVEGLQFKDDKLTNADGSTDIVVDTLNELMQNDKLKEKLDTSGDGKIDITEIKDFCTEVSGLDEDENSVSFKDIIQSAKDFIAKLAETEEAKEVEEAEEVEEPEEEVLADEVDTPEETQAAAASSGAGGASGAGGSSGSGGGGRGSAVGGSSGSSGAGKTASAEVDETMSVQEIESKITETETEISGYQTEIEAINNGTDSDVQAAEDAEKEAYEEYQNQMKESTGFFEGLFGGGADEINKQKEVVDGKQTEVDNNANEISSQTTVVENCQADYDNATSNVENLESLVAALQESDSEDASEKLSGAQSELEAAKTAQSNAKTALEEAEDALEGLNDEKTTLEGELQTEQDKLKELQDDFEKDHPEVKEAREAWETAKANAEAKKQEKLEEVQGKMDTAKETLDGLNEQLREAKELENAKKFTPNDLGDDIVEFAEKFLGYNEGDGSADKFLKGSSSSAIPWCAAYVEYIMENNSSSDQVADWYKNVDNQWYCPTVYSHAKQNNAIISGDQAQKGDIVLFDWQANGSDKDHIGIFCGVENGKAVVIEGNTSNQVAKKYYDLNDSRLTYCSIRQKA